MHFLHIAFFVDFSFGYCVVYVAGNDGLVTPEQGNHLRLRQPYGVGVEADFHLGLSVCALVDFDGVVHVCVVLMIG